MMYAFIIAIAIIQIVFAAVHFLFYKTLVRFFGIKNKSFIFWLKIAIGLLSVSFVLSQIIPIDLLYIFSASWLGFIHFFFWASVLCWLSYLICKIFKCKPDLKIIAGVLFGLAFITSVLGLINAANPYVHEMEVSLPNLPETWKNKTAVFVSDIHLGRINGDSFATDMVEKIMELEPDLVFIGGDYFDGRNKNIDELAKPLRDLKAFRGVYFVTGNHEEFDNVEKYAGAIDLAGVVVLNNFLTNLDGLQIIGVDYMTTSKKNDFKKVLDGLKIDKSKPSILLKHTPTNLDVANDAGINFQLSGHTHKGQIFPYNFITNLVYRGYDYGLKNFADMTVYTSNGYGTWGPPIRVGNRPEIVLIKFSTN